ncbi:MAG: SAM-dependent methyltransferase [Verrucomicrobiota bacterium]
MNHLSAKIRAEIENSGTISFARFMEMALYFPGEGYYEKKRAIGSGGDFFTSVSVGKLFSELLAFQFAEWFEEGGNATLQLVEAGAHDGQLALDVLNWMQQFRPNIFHQLNYCILEPSPFRRESQRKTLAEFSGKISWFADWSDFSALRVPSFSVVFSNELFDAMPVHRIGWNAKTKSWFEWGVGFDGANFAWRPLEKSAVQNHFPALPFELAEVLPDGFATEIGLAAPAWWAEAASAVQDGKIMAVDYGLLEEEFFTPERNHGTARAYYRHQASSDLLAHPGEQDLTAQVNFSKLQRAGESAGWKTESLVSQTKFLTGIAERAWKSPPAFGEWDASRCKQFQTLTHPEHLGRPFRVLIQSRL